MCCEQSRSAFRAALPLAAAPPSRVFFFTVGEPASRQRQAQALPGTGDGSVRLALAPPPAQPLVLPGRALNHKPPAQRKLPAPHSPVTGPRNPLDPKSGPASYPLSTRPPGRTDLAPASAPLRTASVPVRGCPAAACQPRPCFVPLAAICFGGGPSAEQNRACFKAATSRPAFLGGALGPRVRPGPGNRPARVRSCRRSACTVHRRGNCGTGVVAPRPTMTRSHPHGRSRPGTPGFIGGGRRTVTFFFFFLFFFAPDLPGRPRPACPGWPHACPRSARCCFFLFLCPGSPRPGRRVRRPSSMSARSVSMR